MKYQIRIWKCGGGSVHRLINNLWNKYLPKLSLFIRLWGKNISLYVMGDECGNPAIFHEINSLGKPSKK